MPTAAASAGAEDAATLAALAGIPAGAGRRIVLAMSGGVDSSVCAHLLVQKGFAVIGLFMRTGVHQAAGAASPHESGAGEVCIPVGPGPTSKARGCCSALDAADAQRIADGLNIPFYALNFSRDFDRIKDYFAEEYQHGRTPNPCVVCNTWLKFGRLWEYAQSVGAEFIATGHYAQTALDPGSGQPALWRGSDASKDQSYFLFGLRRELLGRVLFPIGGLRKPQVRTLARHFGLAVHDKPDSQEVCFVPTGNYQDFLRQHRPAHSEPEGDIVDTTGKPLARHRGLSHFTIGQRKGLGIAVGEPRYVVELRPRDNLVVIGPREELARARLEAERVNWLTEPPTQPLRCTVKIRYLHAPAAATIEPLADDRVRVVFDHAQTAITPGQATVFYADARVLGGGWIV